MKRNLILFIVLLVSILMSACISRADVKVISTSQNLPIFNEDKAYLNTDVNKLGALVSIYVKNNSNESIKLDTISLNGINMKFLLTNAPYSVIWYKLAPESIISGGEGEIAFYVRETLSSNDLVEIKFSNGDTVKTSISQKMTDFKIAGIYFEKDYSKAYVYIKEQGSNKLPTAFYVNGYKAVATLVTNGYVNGVACYTIKAMKPYEKGKNYIFRVVNKDSIASANIRAFNEYVEFALYGYAEYEKYAKAGFDSYKPFGMLDEKSINTAKSFGIKTSVTTGFDTKEIPDYIVKNDNVHEIIMGDEPDAQDAGVQVANEAKLGHYAPIIVNSISNIFKQTKDKKIKITIDLTYTPMNYFVYSPIGDIATPDCYPTTLGWPLTAFRDKVETALNANAPKPFGYVYQNSWEEWAIGQPDWIGPSALVANGREKYTDSNKVRGFDRAQKPSELTIQLIYALGFGAKSLIGYTDASEAGGSLMFHAVSAMPELWAANTKTVRELRLIKPLMEYGYPFNYVKTNNSSLWVKTLLCGDKGMVVAVVNEDYKSTKEDFIIKSKENIDFNFALNKGFNYSYGVKLEDDAFVPIDLVKSGANIKWNEKQIKDYAVYVFVKSKKDIDSLMKEYKTNPPFVTEDGKKLLPESYLNGVRKK